MYTKAQLIDKGRHYFDSEEVNMMYATADGNFFHQHAKSYADSHRKSRKIELFEITRNDVIVADKAKSNIENAKKEAGKIAESRQAEKKDDALNRLEDKLKAEEADKAKANDEDDEESIRAEGKALKIRSYHNMGIEKLKEKIAEAKA